MEPEDERQRLQRQQERVCRGRNVDGMEETEGRSHGEREAQWVRRVETECCMFRIPLEPLSRVLPV